MICGGVGLLIEMLTLAVAVCAVGVSESVALMVKFFVPSAVGVPEITPVLALRLKPAGRVPVKLHV